MTIKMQMIDNVPGVTNVIGSYNTGFLTKVKSVYCSVKPLYQSGVNVTDGFISISDYKSANIPNLYQVYVTPNSNIYQRDNLDLPITRGTFAFYSTGNFIKYNCSVIYETFDGKQLETEKIYTYTQEIGLSIFTFILMLLIFITPLWLGFKTALKIQKKQVIKKDNLFIKTKIGKD